MNFPDDDALTAGEAALDPALLAHTWPEDFRAGFVAVVGRPNAGKSTLTNALVGAKVAITSGRPETTRHTVRGVRPSPRASSASANCWPRRSATTSRLNAARRNASRKGASAPCHWIR